MGSGASYPSEKLVLQVGMVDVYGRVLWQTVLGLELERQGERRQHMLIYYFLILSN